MLLKATGYPDVVDPEESAAGEGDIPGGARRVHLLASPPPTLSHAREEARVVVVVGRRDHVWERESAGTQQGVHGRGQRQRGGSGQLSDQPPTELPALPGLWFTSPSAPAFFFFPLPSSLLGRRSSLPPIALRLIGDCSPWKRYMRCFAACGGEEEEEKEEELGVVTTFPPLKLAREQINKQAAPAPANGCCVGNTTQLGAESGS